MKSTFVLTAAGAILLVSADFAGAQEMQLSPLPSARATMVKDANESAQSSSDMSYGGAPDTRGATGVARSANAPLCTNKLKCDLFSKH